MSPPAYSVTGTVGSVTGADFHASADDIHVFRQEQDCVIHYEVIQYSNTHRKKAWPPLPSTASGLHITVGHSVHGTSIFTYQSAGNPWVYLQQTYQFSGTGGGTTSGLGLSGMIYCPDNYGVHQRAYKPGVDTTYRSWIVYDDFILPYTNHNIIDGADEGVAAQLVVRAFIKSIGIGGAGFNINGDGTPANPYWRSDLVV